mmetsp:Transcript_7093/g.16246  ORF Transcript_7093/g.16246 Transcript_7093/m.16246 type:complete len:99 (+) Transcript_7093:384-680(+)
MAGGDPPKNMGAPAAPGGGGWAYMGALDPAMATVRIGGAPAGTTWTMGGGEPPTGRIIGGGCTATMGPGDPPIGATTMGPGEPPIGGTIGRGDPPCTK